MSSREVTIDTDLLERNLRPAWAEIDLAAISHNASILVREMAPAKLCAVVKAGAYGHGAAQVARAALDGGAHWLAVALVEEGRELRAAGIGEPVLVLSEPAPSAMGDVVEFDLTPTIYTSNGLQALRKAVLSSRARRPYPVHVKVDTGMHRVGATVPDSVALAAAIYGSAELDLEGYWTHFAVADEVGNPYTATQIEAFDSALSMLAQAGIKPRIRHASNSAGAAWHPEARYDMVRCGIALYGLSPSVDGIARQPVPLLLPAMSLKARVSYVKTVAAGERLSYGLRYHVPRDTVVATVPLGYADGVTRSLSEYGAHVLINGERRPMAGTITMDQLLVDCGPAAAVSVGDEVVLIGRQGAEQVSAWDWASRTGTIAYEVVCGVSGRVPRVYRRG
jgi:alanine racemase